METEAAEAATQHESGAPAVEFDSKDPASMDAALAEVHRRRQERLPAQVEDAVTTLNKSVEPSDPTVNKIVYLDGRGKDKPTTAAEAAKDYNEYKQRLAAEFLQGVIAEEQQAQAAEQHAVEQPAEPTPQQPTPQELAEFEATVRQQQEQQRLAQDRLTSARLRRISITSTSGIFRIFEPNKIFCGWRRMSPHEPQGSAGNCRRGALEDVGTARPGLEFAQKAGAASSAPGYGRSNAGNCFQ